jgi:hypothetical protein
MAESSYRVPNSEMLLLDSDLIEDDHPLLLGTTWDQKADWLLENGQGFISGAQTTRSDRNSPIVVDSGTRLGARRPDEYGRALIYRYLEVKGSGGDRASLEVHDGLLSTQMALREYLFEKMEFIYLRRLLPDLELPIIRSYGVADLKFQLKKEPLRAGNVSRQLHLRRRSVVGEETRNRAADIEEALRYVGITSSSGRPSEENSRANIQLSTDGRLVDLGSHQVFRGRFPKCQFGDRVVDVEAIEEYAAPFLLLGRKYTGTKFEDKSVLLTRRWAEGFADGTLSREEIQNELNEILNEVERRARSLPTLQELKFRSRSLAKTYSPTLAARPGISGSASIGGRHHSLPKSLQTPAETFVLADGIPAVGCMSLIVRLHKK